MTREETWQLSIQRPWHWAVLAVGCCVICSCGSSSPNVNVSGQVIVKGGVPVDEGRLILIPDPPNDKRATCGATIGTDGKFNCYATKGGTGIPPGRYKVVLSFASGKGSVNPFIEAFKKYTQVSTTPLTLDVSSSGVKDYLVELEEPLVKGTAESEQPTKSEK